MTFYLVFLVLGSKSSKDTELQPMKGAVLQDVDEEMVRVVMIIVENQSSFITSAVKSLRISSSMFGICIS